MNNWSFVAVSAAAASSGSRHRLERTHAGTSMSAPRWIFSRAGASANAATRSSPAGTPERFDDHRSRKQITVYLAYRSRACDERNQRALARWNDYLRQQWEIEHLKTARCD
jgi:hypothetical protein